MPFTVFDVETRIDKALVKAVYHRGTALGEDEAFEQTRAQNAARSRSGSDFFPVGLHVPVSIVVGDVDDARILRAVRILGGDGYSEAGIVRDFWAHVEETGGTLVSFNGRRFDLPVLELAALRHGCRLPRYFAARYRDLPADDLHDDLCDFLTNQGAYGLGGGFHLAAQLVGLPGKGEVDGTSVQTLWEAGRLQDIHAYCRRDVIQTYFLFLRIELLRGRITSEQYDAALAATSGFRQQLG